MAQKLEVDFSDPIALFPLPQCVLLPHVTAPLHIFEARYKRMVADALDEKRLVAMAVFEGERWKLEYEASPPIRPCVCLGYIVRHDQMSDGRYNILLQGVCRATVVKEVAQQPYRRGLLEPVNASPLMEIDVGDARQRLERLLRDPLVQQLAAVKAIRKMLGPGVSTEMLVDVATLALCADSDQRYRMLCEPDGRRRARWLVEHLRRTRWTLSAANRLGDPETAEGWTLN